MIALIRPPFIDASKFFGWHSYQHTFLATALRLTASLFRDIPY